MVGTSQPSKEMDIATTQNKTWKDCMRELHFVAENRFLRTRLLFRFSALVSTLKYCTCLHSNNTRYLFSSFNGRDGGDGQD